MGYSGLFANGEKQSMEEPGNSEKSEKSIIKILQGILPVIIIIGTLMLLVPIVDALYGAKPSLAFFVFGALYALASFLFYEHLESKYGVPEFSYFEALISYSLVWIIIPVLTAIPLSIELRISYIDALFESISGFTGTGLTVLRGLDYMSKGVLFWRGLMQWVGELGVIVFASVFLPFFWRFGHILYSLERPTRISLSLRESAVKIFYMYFLITVAGIVVCIYSGVEPLDAIVHVMTAIATGGMSTYDANYEKVFQYAPQSIYPITALMIIGGFNFVVLAYILDGELKKAWDSEEFRGFLYLNLVFSLLSFAIILPATSFNPEISLLYGSFNAISALTTTGFNIGNIASMPASMKLLLILAMLLGGMSFSTAGGIKTIRFLVFLKKIKTYILGLISGGGIIQDITMGEKVLDEKEVSNMILYILLHFFIVLIGAGIIKSAVPNHDFIDAFFEASSAAGAVGLSVGIASPEAPFIVKLVLMVLMYLGRLEYIPLFVVLGLLIYRRIIQVIPG